MTNFRTYSYGRIHCIKEQEDYATLNN